MHSRWMRRSFAGLVLALSLAGAHPALAQPLVLAGQEIADAKLVEAAKKDGKVIIYGTYPEVSAKQIHTAFTADTGIKIEYLRLTSQNLFPRLTAEFAAGKLEADLVDLTDLSLIQDLVDKGLLNRAHKVPTFGDLPAALKDPQGRWYALYRPISTISVNAARVKEGDFPKSWIQVLDPKWSGMISLANIDTGGSAFSMFAYLREQVAPDYWRKLAALKPRIHPSAIPAATDLARGETGLLLSGPEAVFAQIKQGAPLRVLFPEEGISSFPIAGGLTASAKRPNAAALYLNWVLSKHGGDAVSKTGAYASHPEAAAPSVEGLTFPPREKVWNITLETWMTNRDNYSKEWRATFQSK